PVAARPLQPRGGTAEAKDRVPEVENGDESPTPRGPHPDHQEHGPEPGPAQIPLSGPSGSCAGPWRRWERLRAGSARLLCGNGTASGWIGDVERLEGRSS